MCPFQCDLCVFRMLQERDPVTASEADKYLLEMIRRVSLDALWAREPTTVSGNLQKMRELIRVSGEMNILRPPFPPIGPYPLEDVLGYGVALVMVRSSLDAGRNNKNYKQFQTIQKFQSVVTNQYAVSVPSAYRTLALASADKQKVSAFSSCPTHSDWFKRFSSGCKTRMGEDVNKDKALSREILHEVLRECERRVSVQRGEEQALTVSVATFLVVSFCASLRGSEGFMLCLARLRASLEYGKHDKANPHVVVPLLGRFKTELGERYHLLLLASTTKSGFSPRWWLELLVYVREQQGYTNGPAFCSGKMEVAKIRDYEEVFFDLLETVQEEHPELFDKDCNVREWYGLFRSLRRGSTSLATLLRVPESVKNLMNRWRKVEQARGKQPNLPMNEHYTDLAIVKSELIRYCRDF